MESAKTFESVLSGSIALRKKSNIGDSVNRAHGLYTSDLPAVVQQRHRFVRQFPVANSSSSFDENILIMGDSGSVCVAWGLLI